MFKFPAAQQFLSTNNVFSAGPKTGPDPTPPQPNIPTTTPYPDPDETDPTEEPEPTEDTPVPVDPSKDACKLTKFDTITEINNELHFFKDG